MNCIHCKERICLKGDECKLSSDLLDRDANIRMYLEDSKKAEIYRVTTEIPKNIPRIHEVKAYIEKMGIKSVGIAFCKGMLPHMDNILEYLSSQSDTIYYPVICTNNSIKKNDLGFQGEDVTCNPLGQGEILNRFDTQLNLAVGLCVGHDILFSSTSKAPITTLVVKDRVHGHCPLKAL